MAKDEKKDETKQTEKPQSEQEDPSKDTSFVKDVDGKQELRFYPDKPGQHVHKEIFIAKDPSKFYDPCALSSQMAVRCMENHDEDYKQVCGEYFRAYRECKKEWLKKKREGTW